MTRKELLEKLKALKPLSNSTRNEITCSFIGHSNIVDGCMGYMYCGRCGDQIGDALGSVYSNDDAVLIGHGCDICDKNYDKLTWKDKIYVPHANNKVKLLGKVGV